MEILLFLFNLKILRNSLFLFFLQKSIRKVQIFLHSPPNSPFFPDTQNTLEDTIAEETEPTDNNDDNADNDENEGEEEELPETVPESGEMDDEFVEKDEEIVRRDAFAEQF